MTDEDDFDEKRTEGVRIIGAQEAAEAAGRPDVVRRRRRSEKRFGDRPDRPEPAADLPKITISTTESDSGADRFGSVPIVRPDSLDEPRWASEPDDLYGPTDDEGERIQVGHARIVPPEISEEAPRASLGEEERFEDEEDSDDDWGEDFTDGDLHLTGEFEYTDLDQYGNGGSSAGDQSGYDDSDDPDDSADLPGDDSFVLPHWTEPATGQVPKVVIGDDPQGSEGYSSSDMAPRWRDEGEKSHVPDFGDLVEEGPGLGALGGTLPRDSAGDFFDESSASEEFLEESHEYWDDSDDFFEEDRPASNERGQGFDDLIGGGGGGDRNLPLAVGVGVALVAIGLACFKIGPFATALLATVVLTYAAVEYFTAVRTAGYNPATLLGVPAVAGIVFATYTSGLEAYPVVLGLSAVFGLLWYLWVAPGEHAVTNLGVTLLGIVWIGVLGSFATLFLGVGDQMIAGTGDSNPGLGVLIAAVVVAVSHDVGAYFVGRQFGATPLSAASPNKTQEGLVGGVLSAIVVTVVVIGIGGVDPIGESIPKTILFAVLCSLVAPLGDLCESAIKRDLKVKDMGSGVPGHGGVLDRFDAMLFVLPTAYFVALILDVWKI